jgi:integrase
VAVLVHPTFLLVVLLVPRRPRVGTRLPRGTSMALTDARCRNFKPGSAFKKLSDSGGLQLWVQPTGSRLWRMAYRYGGKQKLLALGTYPATSLSAARQARDEAKRTLAEGLDPGAVRKAAKTAASLPGNSFGEIADEFREKARREGAADATLAKLDWLLAFTKPVRERPVRDIGASDVLAILRQVEAGGRYETARRLRSTVSGVFRYAVATARAEHDPTFALRGALTRPKPQSRAALTDSEGFAGLLRAMDAFQGQPTTGAALHLMALLFPRPGELRAAEWSEVQLADAVWTIPAVRTKSRRPHRVPLAPQAITIFDGLRNLTGSGRLVFPSVRTPLRPLSENTLNASLRRLGYGREEATAHGFRASASTLLNESGLWNPDAIERQLAHVESNDVRRAYARGEHWEERVRLMHWWANHLDTLRASSNVVSLRPA